MRLLLKLTLLLVCMGCTTTVSEMTVNEKVQYFRSEFYKNFPYAVRLTIKMERTINSGLHGGCLPDVPVAILNPYSTRDMSDGQLQHLVTHELGHCGLDLAHNSNNRTMRSGESGGFPLRYTVQHVIDLRKLHQDVCDGKVVSVSKLAFDTDKKHESCYTRASIEDSDWFEGD